LRSRTEVFMVVEINNDIVILLLFENGKHKVRTR